MRYKINIYPDTINKIRNSGLADRVNEAKEDMGYVSLHAHMDELRHIAKWLIEEGYYKNIPKDFEKDFKIKINEIVADPTKQHFTMQKNGETLTEETCLSDIVLLSGYVATEILKPEELWQYDKFGFENPMAFLGGLGSYIAMVSKGKDYKEGYKWTRVKKWI